MLGRRQLDADALASWAGRREASGRDAGAVAGVHLAAAGAAVFEVQQHLDGVADDTVALLPLDVGDETDATGVVLVGGIVQALLGGVGNVIVTPYLSEGEKGSASAAGIVRCASRSTKRRTADSAVRCAGG